MAASGSGGVQNPSSPYCLAPAAASPAIPADVGYVRVTEFGYTQPGSDVAFADQVENQIRSRDATGLVGWIVDLRGNGGGDMWPMIAGVGSVLGEGVAGYFVPPLEGTSIPWGYRNGASFSGDSVAVRTSNPYVLIDPAPRVAVLTNGAVASSGEAVVVAFRARPRTRSFGGATCGLSTSNEGFPLTDGATLLLTTAVMADRALTSYGESIAPDVTVAGDAEVVERAIAWLRSTVD
jgi:carboxyl-terminal processing protease